MIQIEYAEHNAAHQSDFVFNVPEGHDRWLLILTHTPAIFLVDHELKEYPAHCAVLYRPGQRIYYTANQGIYENDWVRFFSDEMYVTTTPISCGVPFLIRDPEYFHKLFELIVKEHIYQNSYKDITIDYLFRTLFNKILESFDYKPINHLYRNLNELKNEIYQKPQLDWSLTKMAEKLNISTGYLETIYKETFGVTCIDDVINSRMNLAKKYLLYHDCSIAEVAIQCGYHNVEHFFRQFKRLNGMTPNGFRKGMLGA